MKYSYLFLIVINTFYSMQQIPGNLENQYQKKGFTEIFEDDEIQSIGQWAYNQIGIPFEFRNPIYILPEREEYHSLIGAQFKERVAVKKRVSLFSLGEKEALLLHEVGHLKDYIHNDRTKEKIKMQIFQNIIIGATASLILLMESLKENLSLHDITFYGTASLSLCYLNNCFIEKDIRKKQEQYTEHEMIEHLTCPECLKEFAYHRPRRNSEIGQKASEKGHFCHEEILEFYKKAQSAPKCPYHQAKTCQIKQT